METSPFKTVQLRTLVIWILITVCIFVLGLLVLTNLLDIDKQDSLISIITGLGFYGSLLGWIYFQINKNAIRMPTLLGRLPKNVYWLGYFGILIVSILFSLSAFQLTYLGASYVLPQYVESVINQQLLEDTSSSVAPTLLRVFDVLTGSLIAPIVEELFFRGILLHVFVARWGISKGIILTSIIFGIGHVNLFGGFVFGCLMCLIYFKTKTLLIPMVFHILNNSLVYAIGLSSNSGPVEPTTLEQFRSGMASGFVFLGITLPLIILFLYRNWPTSQTDVPYMSNQILSGGNKLS